MIGEDETKPLSCSPICYNSSRLVGNVLLSLIYVMMMYGNLLYDVSSVRLASGARLVYGESLPSRESFPQIPTEKVNFERERIVDDVISLNVDELSNKP